MQNICEPKCGFVDGCLEGRNVGEWDPARLQVYIAVYLLGRCKSQGMKILSELRLRVASTPPFRFIEILSPEDRMTRVEVRTNDFLAMGVNTVWALTPKPVKHTRPPPLKGCAKPKPASCVRSRRSSRCPSPRSSKSRSDKEAFLIAGSARSATISSSADR